MSSEGRPVGDPADTDTGDPDRVALDELLRAFAIDVSRAADEDRTDTEIDRRVDDVLAEGGTGEQPAIDRDAEPDAEEPGEAPLALDNDAATPPNAPPPPAPSVIAIADDEFPQDASYFEGDLGGPESPAGRPVVFIDDDVVVTESPEDSRRMRRHIEPRLRDRRISVRRAESRRRLRWIVLAGFILVACGAGLAVFGSSLFAIEADHVRVSGNVYSDRVRLQAVVDDLVGTPVLAADTQDAERQLELIPWVDQARVRTDFPHGASIEIRERVALATYAGPDGQYRVIDRDGRILDVIGGQPIAYMLITGPDPVDRQAGEYAPVGYAAAAELVRGLTGSVRGRVRAIDVTADGSQLRLMLDDDTEVRFGAADDLVTKLVRLETALGAAGDQVVSVIDVSTAEVVVQ
jgi:cell division septal protein FtsQ